MLIPQPPYCTSFQRQSRDRLRAYRSLALLVSHSVAPRTETQLPCPGSPVTPAGEANQPGLAVSSRAFRNHEQERCDFTLPDRGGSVRRWRDGGSRTWRPTFGPQPARGVGDPPERWPAGGIAFDFPAREMRHGRLPRTASQPQQEAAYATPPKPTNCVFASVVHKRIRMAVSSL